MVVVAVVVAVIIALALCCLTDDCSDAGACGSADDGSFEAAAEERAENGSAACADESSFAWADSALIAPMVVVVSVVVVVIAAVTAVTHSVIEVGILISVLGAGSHREKTCGQHERGDEYSFSYLHHAGLDAGSVGRVRIFSWAAQGTPFPWGYFSLKVFILCDLGLDLACKGKYPLT